MEIFTDGGKGCREGMKKGEERKLKQQWPKEKLKCEEQKKKDRKKKEIKGGGREVEAQKQSNRERKGEKRRKRYTT